jgi:ribonuclease BN (tRNA processing enzyme)
MKSYKIVSKYAENQAPDTKIFFFWAKQIPITFPVHHLLVGFLSVDGFSTDKFLKESLIEMARGSNLLMLQIVFSSSCSKSLIFNII